MRFARFSCHVCAIYHFEKENRLKRKFHTQKSYMLKRAHMRHDFCSVIIDSFFFFMIYLDDLAGNGLAGMRACFFWHDFCSIFIDFLT